MLNSPTSYRAILFLFVFQFSIGQELQAQISRSDYPSKPIPKELLRAFPCGGETILEEDFESGLPTDWKVLDLDQLSPNESIANPPASVTSGWQIRNDFNDPFNKVMVSPSWYESEDGKSDDWLILPQVTLGNNTCLSWYAYSQDEFFGEDYEVLVSTTTDDTSAFLVNDPVKVVNDEINEFTFRSANLSAYAGQQVYIAFRQISQDQFILALDDIRLAEVVQNDYGTVSLDTRSQGDTIFTIVSGMRNFGSDTLRLVDSVLTIFYSVNGESPLQTLRRDSIGLAPNDTLQFFHSTKWEPQSDGVYRVCAWFEGLTDENINNDTTCVFLGIGQFVGIEEEQEQKLSIYPNPFEDALTIEMPVKGQGLKWKARIIDINGREKWSELDYSANPVRTIPLATLSPGIYLVHLVDESGNEYYAKAIKR